VNVTIDYTVETLPDLFASSYWNMTWNPHISPDSDLVDLFSDLHAKAVVRPGGHRYSLFLVNSTRRPVHLTYGTSDVPCACFALNVRAAFCHLELDASPPLPVLFNYTSQFVSGFLAPWSWVERRIDSRIVVSVVTFGPVVKTASLQNTLNSLFPSLDIVVVVTRHSILDFPVVAAASSIPESIEDAIGNLPPPPTGFAFYVFAGPLFYASGQALFVADWNAESMVVTSVVNSFNRLSDAHHVFGGHHPLFPTGGADSFSPLLSDAFGRSWVLRNVAYVRDRVYEATDQLETIELDFVNRSLGLEAGPVIQKMLARTMAQMSSGEIAKAVSTSERAVKLGDEVVEAAKKRAREARLFAQCCPETIYVSHPRNELFVAMAIAAFFIVVIWLAVKCWRLAGKKRFGIPAALMF
jgi:hypothetical protein